MGMNSDADIERAVESVLDEQAKPMPATVLETVLDRVARRPQLAPRSGWITWWRRVSLAAAAVIVVVVAGPLVANQMRDLILNGPAGPSATGEALHWDAVLQFRSSPEPANPANDGYGNPIVFSYLGDAGAVHDPSRYTLLPAFEAGDLQRWYDPEVDGLSVAWRSGASRLELRPAGGGATGHAAIVAWRSPIDAAIRLAGSVEVDGSCGDGIRFSVDRGSETLETFVLESGPRTFSLGLQVRTGDVLYLIVEPGADSRCDTTWLTETIDTR